MLHKRHGFLSHSMRRTVCVTVGCPSVRLSRWLTAAAMCGWFATEFGRMQHISIDTCRRHVPAVDRYLQAPEMRVASCWEPRYEARHSLVSSVSLTNVVAMLNCRPWRVQHSIMMNVTWRRFDQFAMQLTVGHTTIFVDCFLITRGFLVMDLLIDYDLRLLFDIE